jgi:hypothetical protein
MRWLHYLAFAAILPGQVLSQSLSDFIEPVLLDRLKAEGLAQMDSCPEASIVDKRAPDGGSGGSPGGGPVGGPVTAGNIICGGMPLLLSTLPGGAIHDRLNNMDLAGVARTINNAAAPVQHAFNFNLGLVRQNAWAMQIIESLERPFAVLVTSWASDFVYNEKAAKASNMPTATETQASSTSSGCPQPTEVSAFVVPSEHLAAPKGLSMNVC